MIHKKKSFSILEITITIIIFTILGYTSTSLFIKIQKESQENNIIDKTLNFYVDLKTKDIGDNEIVNIKPTEYNFQN